MIYSELCPVCDKPAVVIPSVHGAERVCSHTALETAIKIALADAREPVLAGAR